MKILIPLDGSKLSEAILGPIAGVVARLDAEVELITVAAPSKTHSTPISYAPRESIPAGTSSGSRLNIPLLGEIVPAPAESREQAVERVDAELHDYLNARANEFPGGECTVTTHVLFGSDPANVIIEYARQGKVDLIAMATHGRTGLSHLLAGSVAEKVIQSGVAPVVVVRPSH
jgi:nucleotide-binding universal stress UspA family protein